MSQSTPRILVGVDFSPSSDRAVAEARQLAKLMGAQLDFVHVCSLPLSSPELPILDGTSINDARRALARLEDITRSDGFSTKSHFAIGNPAAALLDFIREIEPTLVVLGSHGRGAVMRLLVGSVAESLIRRSPVPVLVVPTPERVTVEAAASRLEAAT